MSRFWVGEQPSADLAALVPQHVQRKLDTRRRARSPRPAPPKKPAGPPGGTSRLETLPTELRTQLFAYDGYNLIRELVSLLTASRTCRDTVGAGPRTMITSVLPALRVWRNRVFPHRAPFSRLLRTIVFVSAACATFLALAPRPAFASVVAPVACWAGLEVCGVCGPTCDAVCTH